MESAPETKFSQGVLHYLLSPTIIITLMLIAMYVLVSSAAGDFADPIYTGEVNGNLLVLVLTQCDIPAPIFPWTVLTAIFLHANPTHLISNLIFLIFFGFVLEERVTKSQWLTTFFITGLVGSLSFVAYDFVGNILTGAPNASSADCAVGASGAIYGIMGTAAGLRVVILLIFLFGLNIFAGGGTPAHLGGLVAGLLLRNYWSLGDKPFRGI